MPFSRIETLLVASGLLAAAVVCWRARPAWSRRVAMVLGVMAVAVGVVAAVTPPRAGAPAAPGSPAQRQQLLDNALRAISDGEKTAPRDRWDPAYVIAEVGRSPRALAEWVRANTYWIPYKGMLRGATGVLMDSQGNSLDRSVLLATLIEQAGYTVRLAHGTLTPDQALELLPVLVARRQAAFAGISNDAPARLADLRTAAAQYTLDPASIEGTVAGPADDFKKAAAETRARVVEQSARLLRAAAFGERSTDWAQRRDRALEALQDHWWVEVEHAGDWIDIDVADDGDRTFAPLTSAVETVELAAAGDDDRSHEVVVRVIAERWSPGGLTERKALERVIRPHAVFGHALTLQLWPADALLPGSDGPAAPKDESGESWGVLLLDGGTLVETALLKESGDDPEAGDKGGAFGAIAGGFGDTVGVAKKPQPADSTLSAVWLEYEIHTPGAPAETIRRTVFDLIGPAARAASPTPPLVLDAAKKRARHDALSMRTEILPLVCRVAPEFVAHLAAQSMLGNRGVLQAIATGGEAAPSIADRLAKDSAPTVTGLYTLALARAAWSRNAAVLFDERISLFTKHIYPGAADGKPAVFDATDIVSNRSGVGLEERDGFAARLEQGVLDTNAEALVHPGQQVGGNTAGAYKKDASWVTLGPDAAGALDRVQLSADIKHAIQQDLSAGYIVVAPTAPVADGNGTFSGWWRIDPHTGDALGLGPMGWGQETAEYNAKLSAQTPAMMAFRKMGVTFAKTFAATYVWCLAAIGSAEFEKGGLNLGAVHATLAKSPSECLGDSIAMGILGAVTVPLLALAVEGTAIRPPRVGSTSTPPATPKLPPTVEPPMTEVECPGGTPAPKPVELPPTPPDEAMISPNAKSIEMPARPPAAEPAPVSPKANSVQMPTKPAAPPGTPVSPNAKSVETPARPPVGGGGGGGGTSGGNVTAARPAGPPARYGPYWDGPLAPEEFQQYQEWTEYNKTQTAQEASAAREQYQSADRAHQTSRSEVDAARDAYRQAKETNASQAAQDEAFARQQAAERAAFKAQEDLFKAEQTFSRKATDFRKAQNQASYAERIAEANRKLYQARQEWQQAQQKYQEWQNSPNRKSYMECSEEFNRHSDPWHAANARYEAARSEFYREAMFGEGPTSATTNPTVLDLEGESLKVSPNNPGLANTEASTPALDPTQLQRSVDPALENTQPQRSNDPSLDNTQLQRSADPALDRTQLQPQRSNDPALNKTQPTIPQPRGPQVSPMAKTMSGSAAVVRAVGGGGQ